MTGGGELLRLVPLAFPAVGLARPLVAVQGCVLLLRDLPDTLPPLPSLGQPLTGQLQSGPRSPSPPETRTSLNERFVCSACNRSIFIISLLVGLKPWD